MTHYNETYNCAHATDRALVGSEAEVTYIKI